MYIHMYVCMHIVETFPHCTYCTYSYNIFIQPFNGKMLIRLVCKCEHTYVYINIYVYEYITIIYTYIFMYIII